MGYQKGKKLSLFVVALSATLVGFVMYSELRVASFWSGDSQVDEASNKLQGPGNPVPGASVNEQEGTKGVVEPEGEVITPPGCDLFVGKWVLDTEAQYPLYREEDCHEYMQEEVACLRNGREDTLYQKWKWQPRDCSLPKFKAELLLEKLRNKRLMYIGDSLNWNQWQSMVCMLQSAIPPGRKSLNVSLSHSIFTIQNYNATVEFAWSPYLVDSNSSNPAMTEDFNRIVMLESIARNGAVWENVDYLIFDSYIWWMKTLNMKHLRGSLDEGSNEYDYEDVERTKAYERALRTWANWLDKNVDPNRTTVFFMSMSPNHIRSTDWDNPNGVKCAMETRPILNSSKPIDMGVDRRLYYIAKKVILSVKVAVEFIDITALSEYRKDAHPSVYTAYQGKTLTPEQKANPAIFADCYHWCLPGLPDTWNQLVYTRILARS